MSCLVDCQKGWVVDRSEVQYSMNVIEAEIGKEYISPKGLKVRILRKNKDKSVDIELLEVIENGKCKCLTIPEEGAIRTELKCCKKEGGMKEEQESGVKEEEVVEETEAVPKKKRVSRGSIIDECLLKGGMSSDEITAEVLKQLPTEDAKKVKSQVSGRVSLFKEKGYKVEKTADKKLKVIKG